MKSTNPNLFGKLDDARRERLLELDQLFRSNSEERLTLRWPDEFETRTALNDFSLEGPSTLTLFSTQLRQYSRIMRAGATSISHPRFETVTAPIVDRSLKAGWGDSTDLDNVPLMVADAAPKRLSAFITISDRLRVQNPILAGLFIETQLLASVGAALDDAVVSGSGTGDEPLGILNDGDLPTHTRATAGVDSLQDLCAMEKAVSDAFGEHDPSDYRWITSSNVRSALRQKAGVSGVGETFGESIWTGKSPLPGGGPLNYPATVIPTAPNNTTILAQAGQLAIFDWQQLQVENLLDVTQAKMGFRTMLISGWFDFSILHPTSVIVAVDPS